MARTKASDMAEYNRRPQTGPQANMNYREWQEMRKEQREAESRQEYEARDCTGWAATLIFEEWRVEAFHRSIAPLQVQGAGVHKRTPTHTDAEKVAAHVLAAMSDDSSSSASEDAMMTSPVQSPRKRRVSEAQRLLSDTRSARRRDGDFREVMRTARRSARLFAHDL